jgi:hypothetical protein
MKNVMKKPTNKADERQIMARRASQTNSPRYRWMFSSTTKATGVATRLRHLGSLPEIPRSRRPRRGEMYA